MMKIAVVGNADLTAKQRTEIDTFDHIVRFNNPPLSHRYDGMRTDTLVLANTPKQTAELLKNRTFLQGPVFTQTMSLILPYHPSVIKKYVRKPNPLSWLKGRRADLTPLCDQVGNVYKKEIRILSEELYESTCKQLGINALEKKKYFPSSGILFILDLLEKQKENESASIKIFGFTFEGWKRHKWDQEKELIDSFVANNALKLSSHPSDQ